MRDIHEILALRDNSKTRWSGAHNLMRELEDYYNREFSVTVWGANNEAIKPGTGKSLVDYAVDQIVTDKPIVTCDNSQGTEKAQTATDLSEKFGQRYWYHLDRTRQIPIARQWAKDGMSFDMYVPKGPLFLPERLKDKPTRKKGEKKADYEERMQEWNGNLSDSFPFLVTSVHPVNFFPEDSDEQPSYAFEIGRTTVGQAIKMCNELEIDWDGAGGKDGEEIEWSEFWSAEEFAYFANDILVVQKKNPYGWLPYRVGTAGFGHPTHERDLSKRYQGLLAPARDTLRMQASVLSALKAKFEREGYGPATTLKGASSDILKPPGPEGIVELPDQAEVGIWPQAPMSGDTYRLQAIVDAQLENETYSRTLKGIFPAQGTSGYRERLSIGQSTSKFKPLLNSLEITCAAILRRAVWVAKNIIKEPLFEERFDPKKLVDRPNFKVTLSPVDPQEQYNRIESGLKQRQAGVLDIWTYMQENAQRPDASEAIKALLREKVLFSEPILTAMALAAVKEWGMEEGIKKFEAKLQELLNQGVPPAPQLPPGEAPPAELPPGVPPAPAQAGSTQQMQQLLERMKNQGAPIGVGS